MKKILTAFSITLMVATCMAASHHKDETLRLSELLPAKWSVKEIAVNEIPYNLGIRENQQRGTEISFIGPSIVKGPRGLNDENESFVIWIMTADYVPTDPVTGAQFGEALFLGSNDTISVYWTSFTTGTPSWPTWKEDIIRHLSLKP